MFSFDLTFIWINKNAIRAFISLWMNWLLISSKKRGSIHSNGITDLKWSATPSDQIRWDSFFIIVCSTIKIVRKPKCRMCTRYRTVYAFAYIELNQLSLFFNCFSNGKRFLLMMCFFYLLCICDSHTHLSCYPCVVYCYYAFYFDASCIRWSSSTSLFGLYFYCLFLFFAKQVYICMNACALMHLTNDLPKWALDGWEIKPMQPLSIRYVFDAQHLCAFRWYVCGSSKSVLAFVFITADKLEKECFLKCI